MINLTCLDNDFIAYISTDTVSVLLKKEDSRLNLWLGRVYNEPEQVHSEPVIPQLNCT